MTSPTPARQPFGARLAAATAARGPLCVGIDPHPGLLAEWGLGDDVDGLERFALTVVEALADRVAVLKPQAAFFERHGSRGVAVLERVLAEAADGGRADDRRRQARRHRLDDGRVRGRVRRRGLTARRRRGDRVAVPRGRLARARCSTWPRTTGRGVFVLALTSNPEGAQVQHARLADGRTVAQAVLDDVRALNAPELAAGAALGSIGAVVGATIGGTGQVHGLAVGGPLLAPGSAPRVLGRTTCGRSSGPRCRPCCRAPAGRCSGAARRRPGCAPPRSAPWRPSRRPCARSSPPDPPASRVRLTRPLDLRA